jgi:hypothetical protein
LEEDIVSFFLSFGKKHDGILLSQASTSGKTNEKPSVIQTRRQEGTSKTKKRNAWSRRLHSFSYTIV